MNRSSIGRTILMGTVFAVTHSALASLPAKNLVSSIVGSRYRNGLYRALFCAQTVVLLAWMTRSFIRQPDRVIYQLSTPWSWLLRFGQVASFLLALRCAGIVGFGRFFGISPLRQLFAGTSPDPEPEAQGPRLDQNGELVVEGPYRYTRHGPNLAIFGAVWLSPRMTVNWLTIAIIASIYAVVGSTHEEFRLQRAYGERYSWYQQRVPFMFPLVESRRTLQITGIPLRFTRTAHARPLTERDVE